MLHCIRIQPLARFPHSLPVLAILGFLAIQPMLVLVAALGHLTTDSSPWIAWMRSTGIARLRFAWMLVCAVLMVTAANVLGIVSWVLQEGIPGMVAVVLSATIVAYALVDFGRRLDRLFFKPGVQQLRSNLIEPAPHAALSADLETVLPNARAEIEEVSAEELARLTGQALRRLNAPATLATCPLADRLVCTIRDTAREQEGIQDGQLTPLERARTLREVLVNAIEGLKPADGDVSIESPGALQYHILREEYVRGLQNKQIMARHSISAGTFHRHRRAAIQTLADELRTREERHARMPSAAAAAA
jgi:hypothetical protein